MRRGRSSGQVVGRVAVALAAGATVLAATACTGGDDGATTASTDPMGGLGSTTTAGAATSDPSSSTTVDGVVVLVEVRDGAVVGGAGRHEVGVGELVTMRVTSDTADEVHVHGYDLKVDVEPGVDALLSFDASIPGVFEIELERSGIPLGELEVS